MSHAATARAVVPEALPLADTSAAHPASAPANAPLTSRAHILIVDDEDDLRNTMRELLKMYGFRIDTAANGKEALDSLQRNGVPCLIMLDLMMPVMDGWTFLHELHALSAPYASVPVVIVSAAVDLARVGRMWNHPVFPKPPDIDALVRYAAGHCFDRR
jgi:CheY-like chemotaxis protein